MDLADETVAILGPNGAGKTTMLRGLADEILAGGRTVGLVYQDHRLFPHLSALENVAFGLRARRAPDARPTAQEWLDRVGLGALAARRPHELSGGEQQRVALARALAPGPDVLLLDEPLAALDATTRNDVRRLLRDHLAAFAGPRVLVTHDPIDAAMLADRVMVLVDREVVQTGTVADITARPRHPWVADLAGTNLFAGEAADRLHTAHPHAGPVYAVVSPRAVVLSREHPAGSPRNVWQGTVATMAALGDTVRVHVDGAPPITAEVTAAAAAELALVPGADVWVAVKATEIDVYPA